MRTQLGRWTLVGLGALGALALASCNEEGQDARNIVRLVSLNGNAPLYSDVVLEENDPNGGGVRYSLTDDIAEVTLASRPHDGTLTLDPDSPFGAVMFNSCHVDYLVEDLDGDGSPDLTDFDAPMNVVVPVGGTASGAVLVMTIADKTRSPIICLGPLGVGTGPCSGVADSEYSVRARLTLKGVEETSGDKIEVTAGLQIQLANFADKQ